MNECYSHKTAKDVPAKLARPLDLGGKPLVVSRTHDAKGEPDRLLSIPAVASALGRQPTTVHNDFASGKLEAIQHGGYTYKPHQPPAPQHAQGGLDAIGAEGPDMKLSADGKRAKENYRGDKYWKRPVPPISEEEAKKVEASNKAHREEADEAEEHYHGEKPVKKAEKEYGSGSASLFKPRPAPNAVQSPRDVRAPNPSANNVEGILGRGTTGEVGGHKKEQTPIRKADVDLAAKSAKLDLTPDQKKAGEQTHKRASGGPFADTERKNVKPLTTEQQVARELIHRPIKKSASESMGDPNTIDHTKCVDPSDTKCPKCGFTAAFDNSLGEKAEQTCDRCGETWKSEGPVKLGRDNVGDWETTLSPRERSNDSMKRLRNRKPDAEPTDETTEANPEAVARGRQYVEEAKARYRGKPVQEARDPFDHHDERYNPKEAADAKARQIDAARDRAKEPKEKPVKTDEKK